LIRWPSAIEDGMLVKLQSSNPDGRRRLGATAVVAGLIFWLDLSLAPSPLGAALYVPAALLLYGSKRAWPFAGFAGLGAALSALAGLVGEPATGEAIAGRIASGLILWLVCFLVHRLSLTDEIVRRLITTDPLTGTYNRTYFMELVAREQRRAARYRTVYSIMLVDIDDLRAAYGRGLGDHAIRTIADICKSTLRPTDVLARYGDDEFIIALTHTNETGAVVTARRMREALTKIALSTPQGVLSFASSIGISSYVERTKVDDMITGADHARFLAKAQGPNRVCIDHGPDAPPIFA
jgi:diguanylate cyclase (GGDEF)-like protein